MIQSLIVIIAFAAALFYVGRLVHKQFTAKSGCATGCGKCNTVDFQKIEKQIRQNNQSV